MLEDRVLDAIRSRVGLDNLSGSSSSSGCKASIEGIPAQRVLMNADRAFDAHKIKGNRCCYVLFFCDGDTDTLVSVPIELKGGGVDASDVHTQLQKGADFIDTLVLEGFASLCRPVLIHKNRLHPQELRALNRSKICFRGLWLTIATARCNRPQNLVSCL